MWFGVGSQGVSATGGTKFNSGSYTYHFYVNDAFGPQPQPNKEFTLASGSSINVLVIGGGAGGQNDGGGGGGAGGVHMRKYASITRNFCCYCWTWKSIR